jgi:hypothetical protein
VIFGRLTIAGQAAQSQPVPGDTLIVWEKISSRSPSVNRAVKVPRDYRIRKICRQ